MDVSVRFGRCQDGEVVQSRFPETVEVVAHDLKPRSVEAIQSAGSAIDSTTSSAPLSTGKCCDTAGRETGNCSARTPTALGPAASWGGTSRAGVPVDQSVSADNPRESSSFTPVQAIDVRQAR
nr:hypothetical protein [Mycobacterium sp. SM1]